ncbi:MAG: leucine-rich repeat domain-containing protein [Oscillospiraceae bacterium]|nr:leucine-rich repeat domain-containing protein [Oscillospiraceae bacterium]
MKKKITAMIVCAAVALSLTACNTDGESSSPSTSTKSSTESSKTESSSTVSSSSTESTSDSKPEESGSERTVPKESSVPEPTLADEADFETEAVDGGVCITKYKGSALNVVIPETIGGEKVVRIGEEAFQSNHSLIGVTIPGSVELIDSEALFGAFTNCDKLKEVTFLGDDMPAFAYDAFFQSAWLKEKRTENPDYTIVNDMLLVWRKNEGDVTVPDGVTKIAPRAFEHMDQITGINIPDSVTEIGGYAFHECRGLKNITLSKNITKIAEGTFDLCVLLERIDIPDGVTSIGKHAFYCCGLNSGGGTVIKVPDSFFDTVTEGEGILENYDMRYEYKGEIYDSIYAFFESVNGN